MFSKTKTLALFLAALLLIPAAALPLTGAFDVEVESVTVSAAVPVIEHTGVNYPPVAQNLNYTTFRNVAVNGKFAAVDPEGDLVTYRLLSQPKKGEITVIDSGFIYTPANNKKGRDTFTYVAQDAAGNVSGEATVSIQIEKQATKVTYSDMSGDPNHYAALKLAELGVFTGEKVGGEYYFSAGTTVTRGEFLAMCASLTGIEPLADITRTGFADDSEMPVWVKPYVGAALMNGIIAGFPRESGALVFSPNDPILRSQAVVMLNNALDISDVRSAAFFAEEGILPAWVSQAAANLTAADIIGDISLTAGSEMTRGDAAAMLAQAAALLEARESGKSLLSWAF
ncbi:MAG: S-layer homology domain-containing protein [Oscillospiraceae bacterium]|nr:S-layer homology domain-containing protein [Oscillospiraceae bacterium]